MWRLRYLKRQLKSNYTCGETTQEETRTKKKTGWIHLCTSRDTYCIHRDSKQLAQRNPHQASSPVQINPTTDSQYKPRCAHPSLPGSIYRSIPENKSRKVPLSCSSQQIFFSPEKRKEETKKPSGLLAYILEAVTFSVLLVLCSVSTDATNLAECWLTDETLQLSRDQGYQVPGKHFAACYKCQVNPCDCYKT